ncbi:MAG: hypothetical protein NTW38_02535 [Candidatus Aminicenantes bacterium]|nr:hypothetical protein [Candidatus Aminicenantes bacterium]
MKKLYSAILAGWVAASVSCVIPVFVDEGSRWNQPREPFRQTVAFETGGVLRVDNAFGNIIIRGWDRNELEITAEETWDESAGVPDRSLQRSEIVPRVEVETKDKIVTIKARPRDEAFTGDRIIHLLIQVPHHVVLGSVSGRRGRIALSDLYGEARLRLDDGDIRIENFSGGLDAELGRGSIQAELLDLRNEDGVRLVLNEGPVELSLEPGFNGRLEADAGEGTVVCDFNLTPAAEKTKASGTIGTGEGALIIVSARRGNVSIRKSG